MLSLFYFIFAGKHGIAADLSDIYNNTFIDKENQYDTNVSVIKIKSSLWYQIIFIIKNALKYMVMKIYLLHIRQKICIDFM